MVDKCDAKHRTPLTLAVANHFPECSSLLLKYKADCNLADINKHTPLFRAVIHEVDLPVVELLLEHNARVSAQDSNGKTPLHLAAACGNVSALVALVKAESSAVSLKDDQGCTVLHWACYNENANCVEYLLESSLIDSLEGNPFSPVHCAVHQGSVHCLELLINKFGGQAVAAPRDTPGGRLPLHVASAAGSVECARLILASVCNILYLFKVI